MAPSARVAAIAKIVVRNYIFNLVVLVEECNLIVV